MIVSRFTTASLILPHLFLILDKKEFPSFTNIMILAACLTIIHVYLKTMETCGHPSIGRSFATATLPIVLPLSIILTAIIYVDELDKNDDTSHLGTPLGQVYQYRLYDVISRFREMISTRYTEDNDES